MRKSDFTDKEFKDLKVFGLYPDGRTHNSVTFTGGVAEEQIVKDEESEYTYYRDYSSAEYDDQFRANHNVTKHFDEFSELITFLRGE